MESTYGDRNHENHRGRRGATGRGDRRDAPRRRQGDHSHLRHRAGPGADLLSSAGCSRRHIPSVPVFFDSPMAAEVTEVFRRHRDCLVRRRRGPWTPATACWVSRPESPCGPSSSPRPSTTSRARRSSWPPRACARPAVSSITWPSTSGVRTARSFSWATRPSGTLGRQISTATGRPACTAAGGWSGARIAHIQRLFRPCRPQRPAGLAGPFHGAAQQTFLTHGEEDSALALAEELRTTKGWNVAVPEYQEVVEL